MISFITGPYGPGGGWSGVEIVSVLLLGLFGALVSVGLWMLQVKKWPSWPYFVGRLIVGAGASFVWWALGLPNELNLFLAGFFADKVFESIKERWRPTCDDETT
ncbi:MAG: hypothetical protein DRP01_02500 [Archaeoglobales archaeon]|nr:MAG: hypothetical protein DRP01_02500 [Archaeoglobales archaeon]